MFSKHPLHTYVHIEYKKFSESRGKSHIVRPSAPLNVPGVVDRHARALVPLPRTLSNPLQCRNLARKERKRQESEGDITPYLYPCMVPIKREPLTAFVSDTVAVLDEGGGASGCYRPSGFISAFQGGGCSMGKRSNDTEYTACFTKILWRLPRDFITGEMSVNKNE